MTSSDLTSRRALPKVPTIGTGVYRTFTGDPSLAVTEAVDLGTFLLDYEFRVSGIFRAGVFALGAGIRFVPTDIDSPARGTVDAAVTETVAVVLGTALNVLKLGASPVRSALNHTVCAVPSPRAQVYSFTGRAAVGSVAVAVTSVFQASFVVTEVGVRFMNLSIHQTFETRLGALMTSTSGDFPCSLGGAVIRAITVTIAVVSETVLVELKPGVGFPVISLDTTFSTLPPLWSTQILGTRGRTVKRTIA